MDFADNRPLVSVIIPVYNTAKYVRECVLSVLRQPYGNFEILLVDDGSDQETVDVLNELPPDSRINIIWAEHGGEAHARNEGLRRAKGEYIAFVDSDDYILEDYFSELIPKMQESGCNLAIFARESERDPLKNSYFVEEVVDPATAFKYVMGFMVDGKVQSLYLSLYTKLFHRSVLTQADGSIQLMEESLRYLPDGCYVVNSFPNWGKVYVSPKPYYYVRAHSESLLADKLTAVVPGFMTGYQALYSITVDRDYPQCVVDCTRDACLRSLRYQIWRCVNAEDKEALSLMLDCLSEELKAEAALMLFDSVCHKARTSQATIAKKEEGIQFFKNQLAKKEEGFQFYKDQAQRKQDGVAYYRQQIAKLQESLDFYHSFAEAKMREVARCRARLDELEAGGPGVTDVSPGDLPAIPDCLRMTSDAPESSSTGDAASE